MSKPSPPPLPPPDRAPHLRRGTVLGGSYRLDAVIGDGPSGVVYNAWDLPGGRGATVKVLHPELAALTAALVRLRHDNQAIGRLHHPHLQAGAAALHFTDAGVPFLVRPLWHGETLRQRLGRGPLPLSELCRLFVVLCGAIEAAHRDGVIHGDLKPENLLLGYPAETGEPGESVQVLDFGMHHLRHGSGGIGNHPLLGTASYLAPEQIQGDETAVDGRTDVFGLGTLLFECLTGRVAFDGQQVARVISKICHGEAPRPSAAFPAGELPTAVDVVIEMACHKLPEERFSSPSALWMALRGALTGLPGVEDALRELDHPSSASSTAALLPPSAEPSPAPRPSKRVTLRPRRPSNGALAIQLYKELEEESAQHRSDEPSTEIRRAAAEEAALILDSGPTREARAAQRQAAARPAPQEASTAAQDLPIDDEPDVEADSSSLVPGPQETGWRRLLLRLKGVLTRHS